jgi:Rrf2 family transcriptional regulator, iron-sulfur cluster assembly transcription factor
MKLSKKAEYALRAIVAMSRETSARTFAIQEIAKSENIPLKFLEQILLVLKNGGILRSKRGVGGGYQLARLPVDLTLREVIELIDGPAAPLACSAHAGKSTACDCGNTGGCSLGQTFAILHAQVHEWLTTTTVANVLERERPRDIVSFDI